MENLKQNPMAMLLTMSIEANMETSNNIHKLISKYEANNIDVIPISEIKECFANGVKKALDEDSLMNKLLKEEN